MTNTRTSRPSRKYEAPCSLCAINPSYLSAVQLFRKDPTIAAKQVAGPRQMVGEHDRTLDVGGLAGGEIEGPGPAAFVAQSMDLGVSAAFGAANGLNRSPLFPPPAHRCALTKVVSMETCSGVPDRASVKARNRYCQWPRPDHRL